MKRRTLERLNAAIRLANSLGATLTESGQPRGERRMYALRLPDGTIFDTADIGRVEQKLERMKSNAKVEADGADSCAGRASNDGLEVLR